MNDDNMVVTYTTAPAAYDWFGTEELQAEVAKIKGKVVRKVHGPASHVESQRGRYGSGCHLAVDETEWKKLVDYKLVEVAT